MYVPATRPTNPRRARNTFLVNIYQNFNFDISEFQNVQISINAGNEIPRADRQKEPNKAMNNSKLGTAMANETVKEGINSYFS